MRNLDAALLACNGNSLLVPIKLYCDQCNSSYYDDESCQCKNFISDEIPPAPLGPVPSGEEESEEINS